VKIGAVSDFANLRFILFRSIYGFYRRKSFTCSSLPGLLSDFSFQDLALGTVMIHDIVYSELLYFSFS